MKNVLVLGYGISGKAMVDLLRSKQIAVTISDEKYIDDKDYLPMNEQLLEVSFDTIVKSPGIDPRQELLRKLSLQSEMISDIECTLRLMDDVEVLAITGTNGKTTTTSLLTHLLSNLEKPVFSAGNIGIPIAEIALKHSEPLRLSLELSSFQLEHNETIKPKVAAILNLAPDHLNRYDSLDDYYDAKFNLLNAMDSNDIFLRNIDDEMIVKKTSSISNCQIIDFSLKKQTDVYLVNDWIYYKDQPLFDSTTLTIPGKHNLQNAVVAVMMAYLVDVPIEHIRNQLKTFKAVEHRLEFVKEVNGVEFYNDSKATNPDATNVAIESFDKPVVLLAGGYNKKTGFAELRQNVKDLRALIVFGQTKEELAKLRDDTIIVETLQEAVNKAVEIAKEGDIVLLSPACASFDQFNSFEHRGRVFKDLVSEIAQ